MLDGNDAAERAKLIERRLEEWKSFANFCDVPGPRGSGLSWMLDQVRDDDGP